MLGDKQSWTDALHATLDISLPAGTQQCLSALSTPYPMGDGQEDAYQQKFHVVNICVPGKITLFLLQVCPGGVHSDLDALGGTWGN
ncbi:MAG: hypothetical protein K9I85_05475 [Saprospiraceae bacterium]|nr:hypothetical protein [Saprospiraceae bacterium]